MWEPYREWTAQTMVTNTHRRFLVREFTYLNPLGKWPFLDEHHSAGLPYASVFTMYEFLIALAKTDADIVRQAKLD